MLSWTSLEGTGGALEGLDALARQAGVSRAMKNQEGPVGALPGDLERFPAWDSLCVCQ